MGALVGEGRMAVRIRLSDGSAFVVDATYEQLHEQVMTAIGGDVPLIEVRNGNGKMRSINPRSITYLEETDGDSLTPGEEQILGSLPGHRA
jgi:hypothetical protein